MVNTVLVEEDDVVGEWHYQDLIHIVHNFELEAKFLQVILIYFMSYSW